MKNLAALLLVFTTGCFSLEPESRAPPPPITCLSGSSLWRTAQRLAMVVGSTRATLAPAWLMRYSSASGPKRCESGSATAPIWNTAM